MILQEYIPEPIADDIHLFFSDEDLVLAKLLLLGWNTDRDLMEHAESEEFKERLGAIVEAAYRKELIDKRVREDGTMEYLLRPANDVVNNATVFRQEMFQALPEETRVRVETWLYDDFLRRKKSMAVKDLANNGNEVLPLDAAIDYLKAHGDYFYVIPCDCACKFEGQFDRTKDVCICLERGLNSHEDRGLGEKLTQEEAISLLRETERLGLVHSAEMENICNCDVRYCYPTRASLDMGVANTWPATKYIVSMEADACVGCGICETRCQFGVLRLEDCGTISTDFAKCWGCGVCVSTCPVDALRVVRREA